MHINSFKIIVHICFCIYIYTYIYIYIYIHVPLLIKKQNFTNSLYLFCLKCIDSILNDARKIFQFCAPF